MRFSAVEQQVMEDVFNPTQLREQVPGIAETIEGASHLRDVLTEINQLGQFQKANGFSGGRTMQSVAKIDTSIMLALDQLHEAMCTCGRKIWGSGGHKEWFMMWLSKYGADFDVRGKVIP